MEQFTINANKSGGYIVGNLICGDSKTTTIHIVVPRMSGAIDLSVLTFVVNIKNSANKTDIAPVFNRIVSDEYIEFDWIPGGIATSDIGITRFEIEGVNANNAIWQSSTYLLRILKSLDSEAIDEENVISELHQMIILVDNGLRKAEEAANIALQISEHLPIIGENGNWLLWDTETNSYVDSNKSTKGDEGEPGKDGISVTHEWNDSILTITSASGVSSADLKGPSGKDGVSPIVYVSVINDGHRLFIEDINGTKSFDVLDGKDGVGISSARLNDDYTLTLNFSDGSSHTTSSIRGEVGPSGSDGYTPVRGIDYWTDADKVEVVRDTTKHFPFLAQSDEIIYVLENSDIDTTLTQAGKVADAKAVGDAINQFSDKLAAEHSLIGNTSELTPLQVAEAFTAGKNIRLTHTDAQLGTVTVSDFKYLKEHNMVVSSGVQQVYDTLVSYALSGAATAGAGWAFAMSTVPTTDQVPIKVSQLNNDAGFVTQEDLDSLSEEIDALKEGGEATAAVWDVLNEVVSLKVEDGGTIPEQRITLDDAMHVGKVDQAGRVDTSAVDYYYTDKIKLNSKKTFEFTGVNLNGLTVHPAIRYVTPYDADGNVLSAYSLQSVAEASLTTGRTITMDASVDSVILTVYKAVNYTDKTVILPAVESGGGSTSSPEEIIALDDTMSVGAYFNINGPDTTQTDYKYTNKIKLNATKSFELTAVNLNGVTIHPQLRYVVAFDAAGNYLADHKMEKIAEASVSEGRIITMADVVDSVIVTIYKADNYTDKKVILPAVEGDDNDSGGNEDVVIKGATLKTEKLSDFESELLPDDVCYGTHKSGVFDYSDKRTICTRDYIPPFVKSIEAVDDDFQLAVAVYKNGAYVRTVSWITNGNSYVFDHAAYQYKLYIMRTDGAYMNTYEEARKSVKLTLSSADVLFAYNKMKAQMDVERDNMRNAMEYMMRRNYDVSYANAAAPLNLISYLGNNQIVHPKVLYIPNRFGGHRYWMAYTPYPFAVDTYENPCIAYSDDGYEWTNIDGNPLDDPAGVGYNSDTHLVYNESTGTMEVWYRYVGDYDTPPVSEIIYRQTSTDGVNWSAKEVVINNDSGDYVLYLSPAILYDGSKYKMWVVNGNDRAIHYYESADLSSFTEVRTIDLDYADGGDVYRLWHIDVIEDNGKIVLLGMGKTSESASLNQKWTLLLATSGDNITFTTPEVIMRGNPYGWDKQLYRSSVVNVNGEYRIYYSAQNETQRHGLGVSTSNKLSEFVGRIY